MIGDAPERRLIPGEPPLPPNPYADDEAYDAYFADLDQAERDAYGWYICANCGEVALGQAGDTRQCDRCAEIECGDEAAHQRAHGVSL